MTRAEVIAGLRRFGTRDSWPDRGLFHAAADMLEADGGRTHYDAAAALRSLTAERDRLRDDAERGARSFVNSVGEVLRLRRKVAKYIGKARRACRLMAIENAAANHWFEDANREHNEYEKALRATEAERDEAVARLDAMTEFHVMQPLTVERLKAERDEALAALRWYAKEQHYDMRDVYMGGGHGPSMADVDRGARARALLAKVEK